LDSLPPPSDSLKPPVTIIPELSHLHPRHDTPRSSVETLGNESTAAFVKRRAKTPVHHIGELEARARARKLKQANLRAAEMREAMAEVRREQSSTENAQHTVANGSLITEDFRVKENAVQQVPMTGSRGMGIRTPGNETTFKKVGTKEVNIPYGVDPIAEQYKALLAPRETMFAESHSEPSQSRQEDREGLAIRRQRSSGDLRRDSQTFTVTAGTESPQGSPTSDGTLVAFEEETVYFKPVSFSPEPPSPKSHNNESNPPSPLPTPGNIGFKICVDLLAGDLTSAVTKKNRTEAETSALQVWTMIEGYERLRERIVDSGLQYDEVLSLEQTFDTWLKALYTTYDRLTGADYSGSDYDDFEQVTPGMRRD
jgi:hypothetical protein